MKSIKILVSLALALAMMAMPVASLAEAAGMSTATIDNFVLTLNGEPTSIGLSLKGTLGAEAERLYFAGTAQGDGKDLLNGAASMEDGKVRLTLDGLTSNYEISMEDLQKLFAEQAQKQTGAAVPFDAEAMQNMITSYTEMMQQALAMDPAESQMSMQELLDLIGSDEQPTQEEVSVFGETVTLNKVHLVMDPAAIDKLMKFAQDKMPAVKGYMESYTKMMAGVSAAEGTPIEIDPENMMESMNKALGANIELDMTIWYDDAETTVVMDMIERVSGEGQTVEVPVHMEYLKGDSEKMTMNMDMNMAEGQSVAMTMNMDLSKESRMIDVKVSGGGNTNSGSFSMLLSGTGSEPSNNSVTFSAELKNGDQEALSGSLSFDVTLESAELPEGELLDLSNKPVIDLGTMTEEQGTTLTGEATTALIMAYGQAMQTSGVSDLLNKVMSMIAPAVEPAQTEAVPEAAPAA